jgi:hypothetical protein
MKLLPLLTLLIFIPPSFSEEVLIDKEIVKRFHESASVLGICATIESMSDIAIENKDIRQEKLIFSFLQKKFVTLKSLNEWDELCDKHRKIVISIDNTYNLNMY